ncbi:MAG: hypothetical protein IJ955_08025 [Oscillospiraceae bacterium]|nr:hypothetical protein [Oscillospiraceae bacterium]MBR2132461.1 hypothetical protein [Oscillospiraceae bacterium]
MEEQKRKSSDEQNKKKTTLWIHPDLILRMDSWLEHDNCKSRSEFIDKALRFYMGYLSAGDTSDYLCSALVTTLRGTLENNNNRMRSLLFKWAVELNLAVHTIAAHFDVREGDRDRLRWYAIEEVKRTNGQISFDHAVEMQKQLPSDEWQE